MSVCSAIFNVTNNISFAVNLYNCVSSGMLSFVQIILSVAYGWEMLSILKYFQSVYQWAFNVYYDVNRGCVLNVKLCWCINNMLGEVVVNLLCLSNLFTYAWVSLTFNLVSVNCGVLTCRYASVQLNRWVCKCVIECFWNIFRVTVYCVTVIERCLRLLQSHRCPMYNVCEMYSNVNELILSSVCSAYSQGGVYTSF